MNRSLATFFGLGTAAALGIALLGGCGNGGASEPLQTSIDPAANSKLQFAVGVATWPLTAVRASPMGSTKSRRCANLMACQERSITFR